MRNLKKLLALVLAMVMAFSLMLSAGAVDYADYPDKDSITAEFDEAVQVLTGLAVMQGDEKGFRPSDKITRAEAAAVIYRAVTGDVTDRQTDLYKDYSTFVDVKSDDWFAGYVGYCQNAGYIKGTSPTTFNPYGQVTGYEVLAMILRAVGYGKNNEFTGAQWQVNVAALSKQLGVTRDVVAAHMDQTLNMAAPREVVADLVFMTMATVPMVTFTPALAYNDKQSVVSNIYNPTLGQQIFGLFHDVRWKSIDDWGRPGYDWFQNGVWRDNTWLTTANTGFGYVIPADHPWYWAPTSWTTEDWEKNVVATIGYAPSYETKEQVLECDVADALDIETQEYFRLFVNGTNGGDGTGDTAIGAIANTYRIVATDTVTKVGGQGRITEFYYNLSSKWFLDDTGFEDRAVMIDTFLTRIDAKHDAKLDPAGHVITPAQLEVTIYDGPNQGATNNSSSRVLSKDRTDATNWDEYSVGDYILINAWTNKAARTTSEQRESAAFQTNKVVNTTNSILFTDGRDQLAWIVDNGNDGKAENFQAKQTTVYYNQGKHNVDNKDYMDQIELYLNLAGTTTNTTFTWFLDQFGNLIGIGDAHAIRYGIITSIYAAFGQGESDTTGAVKAVAKVTYADGTKGEETIDKFRVSWGSPILGSNGTYAGTSDLGTAGVTAAGDGAGKIVNGARIGYRTVPGTRLETNAQTAAAGANLIPDLETTVDAVLEDTLELRPVYDTTGHAALSVGPIETRYSFSGVSNAAWLYLAPSTVTNTNAHNASATTDAFGILYDNLFQFSVADDNSVVATEVAGSWAFSSNDSSVVFGNPAGGNFANKANGVNITTEGKLYKTLSYLSYTSPDVVGTDGNATGTTAGTKMVYVDNDTQIMVNLGGNGTVNTYNGVSALPGDVTIPTGAEIDWADTDGDQRADVLYISNGSIPSTITYGLFYYNGTGAQWNGSDGTITGYLDGKSTNLTFSSRTAFTTVNSSMRNVFGTAGYAGHLFAVRMENGEVTDVLEKGYTSAASVVNTTPYLLASNDVANASYALANISGPTDGTNAIGLTNGAFNDTATGAVNGVIGTPTAQAGKTADAAFVTTPTTANALENPVFGVGAANGNSYTANTRAVYYRDTIDRVSGGDHYLSYVRESGGQKIEVRNTANGAVVMTYWLAPTVDVVGELVWLNMRQCDVTMVYEEGTARSVTQIYIATDPTDITPDQYGTVSSSSNPTGAINLPSSTDSDDLRDEISGGKPNTVIYSPYAKNPTGMAGIGSSAPAANLLYFPYTAPAGNYSLIITNVQYGNVVYSEGPTAVSLNGLNSVDSGNAHCFVIDLTNATNTGVGTALETGVEYRYQIVNDAAPAVVYSTGTFTLN